MEKFEHTVSLHSLNSGSTTLRDSFHGDRDDDKLKSSLGPEADGIPNGGFLAWCQVLGSFFLAFNCWGLTNGFGVFQTYYETELLRDQSPSSISWIGSTQGFILSVISILAGPAYDAGYFHFLLYTGTFLIVFGFMMTSICTSYWQVMLSQGVVVGLGAGCLGVPAVAILPQYFTTKRAMVNGVAMCGSSAGFGWTTRILAFIALGTLIIPIAIMRIRTLPKSIRTIWSWTAFKELPYDFAITGMFFGYAGLYIPMFYVQSVALHTHSVSQNLAFYMLPILNAASIPGRILPNLVANKLGALNVFVPTLLIASIFIFSWTAMGSESGILAFSILYGFFSGTILSLPQIVIISLAPSLDVVGTRLGAFYAIGALGMLIGNPVAGELVGSVGEYTGLQVFSGACALCCACMFLAARFSKTGLHLAVRV
ncbi:MAG: hypothetical protein M1834_007300 [Cirrosporium novae-zelandiae]|nr:MAG: hypothetical protein M1834_007300 [Cirrosporium novae-zelandiae]